MKRLIDDKEATWNRLYRLIWGADRREGDLDEQDLDACIEELYAPIPEWYDKIDPDNSDTWVLCFVNDTFVNSRISPAWVTRCECGPYPFTTIHSGLYKYATPVDLSIRYEDEESW